MTKSSSRELMRQAMLRKQTERIPTMPQICHDTAIRVYESDEDGDWIDALQRCVENPAVIDDYVIRLVEEVDCDGLRLFVNPKGMKVVRQGNDLIVLDPETDERLGQIDTLGSGEFVPDCPPPPVMTLDDAKVRLEDMVRDYSESKMERLRNARERVPSRFVASAPGSITMDTYITLRGLQQAMIDLIERPSFVAAVMDMQVEAVIQRAEKLLATGIDALYIGGPSDSSSLISPQHFEQLCLPAYQKFCSHFEGKDILIYLHICGNTVPILEMMAETGVDVVEPLDPLGGVSVSNAKQRIGDKVGLMGGVNPLTLVHGTSSEVRIEAIQKCREGGPIGYILAAGDMVPPETPLENLRALVEVATKSLWKE